MKQSIIFFVLFAITITFCVAQSIPISGNQYHLYGPNSWGISLQVGGYDRLNNNPSIYASNGNVHIDSKENYALYLNHYSLGNTFLNPLGGKVGIGIEFPTEKLSLKGNLSFNTAQIPMGIISEEQGTFAPLINFSMNFREINKRNDYRGAAFRIDSRNQTPLFQWLKRSAGSETESILMSLSEDGNLGLGVAYPVERFAVNGNIRAREVKVESSNWPDYVFEENYSLPELGDLEKYIRINKHLPEIPTAKTIAIEGFAVGDLIRLQQKKIEELTLYLIEKNKQIAAQQKRLDAIDKILAKLIETQPEN